MAQSMPERWITCSACYYGTFTARKELRSWGGVYWTAYRTRGEKLRKAYLGKAEDLTLEGLGDAAANSRQAGASGIMLLVERVPPAPESDGGLRGGHAQRRE
jgi:hypothetical protein